MMDEINFEIAKPDAALNFSKLSHIDEEGLLPGNSIEAKQTVGLLSGIGQTSIEHFHFAPLEQQVSLNELHLSSGGVPLQYTLSNDSQQLIASKGEGGDLVFTIDLSAEGEFTFTLHSRIDREPAANRVENQDFQLTNSDENPTLAEVHGWQIQTSTENIVEFEQSVPTQANESYQLTFFYQPFQNNHAFEEIKLYWGGQLLHTILPEHQTPKAFAFAVDGKEGDSLSALKFVGIGENDYMGNYINHVSLTLATQKQLPIDFVFEAHEQNGEFSDFFTINVTTTPPLVVNSSQLPIDICFEQCVYQTIVLNDQTADNTPFTTINIDGLFKNLSIPSENRVVSIVQKLKDGTATNAYEVQISDNKTELLPITIADVLLSFPGGDGGLSVFQKNIFIDDGRQLLHIMPEEI